MESCNFLTGSQIFGILFQNQQVLEIYLEDNSKLIGSLQGWDPDYLLIQDENSLQIIPGNKIMRLKVALNDLACLKTNTNQNIIHKLTPNAIEVAQPESSIPVEAENLTKSDPPVDRLNQLIRNL